MPENEAIEELKYDCNEIGKAIPCDTSWGKSFENAYAMAINALEEVQQYRTIGTPEECRKSLEICKAMVERNITPDDMENYMKFEDESIKQGFTLDSILKSREKQTAKKIEIFNGQASCPNCKHFFGEMNVIRSLIAWNMPYCKHCGQKLDWSDE